MKLPKKISSSPPFDLNDGDFRRALGSLKAKERVALLAKYCGATDDDLWQALGYDSEPSYRRLIDESVARVFELCDQFPLQRVKRNSPSWPIEP